MTLLTTESHGIYEEAKATNKSNKVAKKRSAEF